MVRAPGAYLMEAGTQQQLASLALALLRRGYLGEEDEGRLADLVMVGLTRLAQRSLGTPELIDLPRLEILSSLADRGVDSNPEEKGGLYVVLTAGECWEWAFVGNALEALEKEVPGLGQTTLHAIESASQIIGAHTPGTVLREVCAEHLWYGETEQAEWLEALSSYEGISAEELDEYDLLGPEEARASIPYPWVFNARAVLSRRKLVKLARRAKDHRVRQCCSLIVLLRNLCEPAGWAFPGTCLTECLPAYHPVCVRWSEGDFVGRALDDWYERYVGSGDGFTTDYSVWSLGEAPQEMERWVAQFANGLRILKTIDTLLGQLVDNKEEVTCT